MNEPKPIFEVRYVGEKDGRRIRHVWAIYADGRTRGFPDGAVVVNRLVERLSPSDIERLGEDYPTFKGIRGA